MFFYFFCQCIKMLHVGDKVNVILLFFGQCIKMLHVGDKMNVILLFLSVYKDVTCRG